MRKRAYMHARNKGNYSSRLFRISIFLIIILFTVLSIDAKLKPTIREYAKSTGSYYATKAINDAVIDEIASNEIKYLDLVSLEKDNNGGITALYTNIVKINELKAKVANLVLDKLRSLDESAISVPFGNASGINLFSGRGPDIPIKIIPIGSITTSCASQFSSAGINQTRHSIIMEVVASVTIVLPRDRITTKIHSEVNIAETILVGNVPESYTNIVDTRDLIEKGIDYALE